MKLSKALLALNLFALQSYLIRFQLGPYPSNVQEVLLAILGLIFVVELIWENRFTKTLKSIWKHWLIWGLIGLSIFSTVAAYWNGTLISQVDFIRHLKFLFFGSVLALIFLELCRQPKEQRQMLLVAGYGALAFALFSIAYNLLGYNVAYDQRLLGPLDSAVYLAIYLTPFLIFFSLEAIKNKRALIPAGLLFLAILATRSLGAIGGYFVVMLLFFLLRADLKILKKWWVKGGLVLCALTLLVGVFFMKVLPTLQSESSSLHERGEIWLTSAHLLKEPSTILFGLGPSQFEAHYIQNVEEVIGRPPLDFNIIQPHNLFLLFQFHYGVLGLIFLLYLAVRWWKQASQATQLNAIQMTSLLVVAYFVVHGMIDTPWYKNDLLPLIMIFGSLMLLHPSKNIK